MGVHLGVYGFIPSHSWECKCDSRVAFSARTFPCLCLGCKPKVRGTTIHECHYKFITCWKVKILLVEVCHGYEKLYKIMQGIEHNKVHSDVPLKIFIVHMLDVEQLSLQPMVVIPHKKHSPWKKTWNPNLQKEDLKFLIFGTLVSIPKINIGIKKFLFSLPIQRRYIKYLISLIVSNLKCLLRRQNIYFEGRMNDMHINHHA